MDPLPISVCIISGPEVRRIEKLLASIAGWTTEIVVLLNEDVHDGTEEIAKKFGARILRHPWQGFRDQKNLVLTHARQPWILSLDADEEVSPALHDSIRQFFRDDSRQFSGACFPRKVWFLGRWITHGDWYPDYVLRLFKRECGRWAGTEEHCKVEVQGDTKKITGDLHHYTNPTISGYVLKMNYYADLHLQRQLEEGAPWSAFAAAFRSGWRFVRAYIFRLGFLDGFPGFFIAASTAYSTLVRHSRLFEHQQAKVPPCDPPKSH
jgi:glycosyltransferase involved in cell wall biosynthesis